jgi:hypothetical protein
VLNRESARDSTVLRRKSVGVWCRTDIGYNLKEDAIPIKRQSAIIFVMLGETERQVQFVMLDG